MDLSEDDDFTIDSNSPTDNGEEDFYDAEQSYLYVRNKSNDDLMLVDNKTDSNFANVNINNFIANAAQSEITSHNLKSH
jgi:hypothetical protein